MSRGFAGAMLVVVVVLAGCGGDRASDKALRYPGDLKDVCDANTYFTRASTVSPTTPRAIVPFEEGQPGQFQQPNTGGWPVPWSGVEVEDIELVACAKRTNVGAEVKDCLYDTGVESAPLHEATYEVTVYEARTRKVRKTVSIRAKSHICPVSQLLENPDDAKVFASVTRDQYLTSLSDVVGAVTPARLGQRPPVAPAGAPNAVADKAYQARLDAVAGRLQRAMRSIKTARTPSGLSGRLQRASSDLDDAAGDLREFLAPKLATEANGRLARGLSGLAAELSSPGPICHGPSMLTTLSGSDAAGAIRLASFELAQRGYETRRLTVRPRRERNRRLPNGQVISRGGTGPAGLTVFNQGETDAVVKLVGSNGRTAVGMYVRAGSAARAAGIPLGTFRALVADGEDFDRARRSFNRDCRYSALAKRVTYTGSIREWRLPIQFGDLASGRAITEREFRGQR